MENNKIVIHAVSMFFFPDPWCPSLWEVSDIKLQSERWAQGGKLAFTKAPGVSSNDSQNKRMSYQTTNCVFPGVFFPQ